MRFPHKVTEAYLGLAVLLALPDDGLAQGYRMRVPTGGHLGTAARPPRLAGTPPSTVAPPGGFSRRRLVDPYPYFGLYLFGLDRYAYQDDSAGSGYDGETDTAREVYPIYDTAPDVGRLELSSRHIASRLVVRLTWHDPGLGAAHVAFFLADSAQRVLSAQTVRSPPFTALFQPSPGTAFAGMTVALPGGTLVTRFVPYRKGAR